ncbi:MAG: SGNH/GDSL hydrolase family protein [Desulfosarcina sp.]|nr:SGNH/GDSL hydrolase family protein [Desulfobacterales bacterium]
MKKRLLISGVLFLCLTVPFGATVFAYNGMVSFGDSLSDNGPADGYGLGVWSNGPVWVDYLAADLGVGLLDMAYGGARTDYHPATDSEVWGFGWQVDEYINNIGTTNHDTLYTVWIGGNDLLNISGDPVPVITNAVTNISLGINSLIGAGAENILVMNMPNLGATPYLNGQNLEYGFYDDPVGGEMLADAFNDALDLALTPYRTAINLFEVDVFSLMEEWAAEELFDNHVNMLIVNQPTDDSYMFWDAIHPTTYAHSFIAQAAFDEVASVPEPAIVLLLGTAFLALAGASRKKFMK